MRKMFNFLYRSITSISKWIVRPNNYIRMIAIWRISKVIRKFKNNKINKDGLLREVKKELDLLFIGKPYEQKQRLADVLDAAGGALSMIGVKFDAISGFKAMLK